MTRIQLVQDYADFLIKARAGLAAIQKALNHNRLEEAKILAQDVKINVMFLQDAIEKEEMKSSR